MGIKAIVLEAVKHSSGRELEWVRRILATYSHGDKFSQSIYKEKIKEIEAMLKGELCDD
jgi:hypothetical protein